jgi:hypothetical protein
MDEFNFFPVGGVGVFTLARWRAAFSAARVCFALATSLPPRAVSTYELFPLTLATPLFIMLLAASSFARHLLSILRLLHVSLFLTL